MHFIAPRRDLNTTRVSNTKNILFYPNITYSYIRNVNAVDFIIHTVLKIVKIDINERTVL